MTGLIETALAEGSTASPNGGIVSMLPIIIIITALMYFLIIRPQSKRAKEHRHLVDSLQVGDEVVTIGGMLGVIEKITDNYVILRVAENTIFTIQKSAVATILPRGTLGGI